MLIRRVGRFGVENKVGYGALFSFLFSAKQARLLLLRASESTARPRVPTVHTSYL